MGTEVHFHKGNKKRGKRKPGGIRNSQFTQHFFEYDPSESVPAMAGCGTRWVLRALLKHSGILGSLKLMSQKSHDFIGYFGQQIGEINQVFTGGSGHHQGVSDRGQHPREREDLAGMTNKM